jgi:hypothetical protein
MRTRAIDLRVRTVRDRMQFVLDTKGWSAREWARRAGLKEEGHVGGLIRRMKKAPARLAGDIGTYAKLADAASVSLDWLVLGRGQPDGIAASVAEDEQFPSRARVIVAARLLFFDEPGIDAVIEAVCSQNDLRSDPGTDYWRQLVDLKRAELRVPSPSRPASK